MFGKKESRDRTTREHCSKKSMSTREQSVTGELVYNQCRKKADLRPEHAKRTKNARF